MKHKGFWFALIVILAALAVLPVPVSAQDGLPGCSDDEIAATLEEAADLLAQAQEQSGIDALDALIDVKATLAAVEHCRGLDFEGDSLTVYDPVYVPEGIYRVTVTADGFFILHAIILEGVCDNREAGTETSIFRISRGEATEGAQTTFISEGCLLLWQTDNVTDPYTVSFEKIR